MDFALILFTGAYLICTFCVGLVVARLSNPEGAFWTRTRFFQLLFMAALVVIGVTSSDRGTQFAMAMCFTFMASLVIYALIFYQRKRLSHGIAPSHDQVPVDASFNGGSIDLQTQRLAYVEDNFQTLRPTRINS